MVHVCKAWCSILTRTRDEEGVAVEDVEEDRALLARHAGLGQGARVWVRLIAELWEQWWGSRAAQWPRGARWPAVCGRQRQPLRAGPGWRLGAVHWVHPGRRAQPTPKAKQSASPVSSCFPHRFAMKHWWEVALPSSRPTAKSRRGLMAGRKDMLNLSSTYMRSCDEREHLL